MLESLKNRLEELSLAINEGGEEKLTVESLVDAFIALHTDCKASANQNEYIGTFAQKCERQFELIVYY
jgi:hypothetical protein